MQTAVPELSMLMLLGLAAGMLVMANRRRKTSKISPLPAVPGE
jgi:hypothetical protein